MDYVSGIRANCIFFVSTLILIGCGSTRSLNEMQMEIRNEFVQGNYEEIANRLSDPEVSSAYRENSSVIRDLELANAQRMNRRFEESNQAFDRAESEIERLFGTSVDRNIRAFLVNDGQLEYQGEDYEDIYINLFKSLNYMHLRDFEAATVEARRMVFKMESVQDRYSDLLERMENSERGSQLEWSTGDPMIQNSALGHYLAAILYNVQNRPDNARIEFNRLKDAWQDQMGINPDIYAEMSGLDVVNGGNYNVLLMGFAGRAPMKVENTLEVSVGNVYGKLAYPTLNHHNTRVRRVRAVVNDEDIIPLHLIEDMSTVATEIFEIRRPIIVARGTIRSVARAVAANRASSVAENRGGAVVGFLARQATNVMQQEAETADLRTWQSLPGKAFSNVLLLPEGTHNIRLEFMDALGNVIHTQYSEVTVDSSSTLELSEHMYFN